MKKFNWKVNSLRRKYLRHKSSLSIYYSLENGKLINAEILDISENGAKLRILQILKPNTIIYIHFLKKKIISNSIKAIIVYCNNQYTGIQFLYPLNNINDIIKLK